MICPACQAENADSSAACARCGASLGTPTSVVVSVDLSPGALFHGRYEIVQALGQGGMGMVYRARDRSLDEPVAIKVLRPDFAQESRMGERFKSEIKLARKVRHKNVCTIHDYGEDHGLLFISMELVQGTELKKVVRGKGLPAPEAYDVAIQVAEGLQAVHEAGIIHRDLKTANIMLDDHGVARLMDFGIAKKEGEATLTATGQVVGTPEYMSPEQAQGKKVDFRSDLYSLGVVIYGIFTGDVPFRGDTPISTILKHLQDPPPLDSAQAATLPPSMKAVLRKVLAKEPEDRYSSARELAEALRLARSPSQRQVPIPTSVLEAPTLPRPKTSSRAVPPWAWGVAVLALAAGAVALWHRPNELPPPPTSAATATPSAPSSAPSPEPTPVATPFPAPPEPIPETAAPAARPSVRAVATPPPAPATVAARPAPALTPSPPPPAPAEAVTGSGMLQVIVHPWAEVTIDGTLVGTTPLDRISLSAGTHTVRLRHPGYEVVEREVTIQPGQTERLRINLATEGVRKR